MAKGNIQESQKKKKEMFKSYFTVKQLKQLQTLQIYGEAKYFDISKATLFQKLNYSASSNAMGWSISFENNKVVFKSMDSSGGMLGTEENLSMGEYTLYNENDQIIPREIYRHEFFPNVEQEQLGMYFLNFGELKIAIELDIPIEFFRFSLAVVNLGTPYLTNNNFPPTIPILKIEIKRNGLIIPNQYNPSPSVLIAPPCPPIWKPGFTNITVG